MIVYECHNPASPMNLRGEPGRFTGGITEEQIVALDGEAGAPFGEGYCPTCGVQGVSTGEEHVELPPGNDPLDPIHEAVRRREFNRARELLAAANLSPQDTVRMSAGIDRAEAQEV